jgi:hypothetical protein
MEELRKELFESKEGIQHTAITLIDNSCNFLFIDGTLENNKLTTTIVYSRLYPVNLIDVAVEMMTKDKRCGCHPISKRTHQ